MERANPKADVIVELIDVSDDERVRVWVDRFDITKAKLKTAVNAVGNSSKEVEIYLQKKSRK